MYLIVVYDVKANKCPKVHKFLKKRLHWIQNSVFEGEISKSEIVKLKSKIKKIVREKKDCVVIYEMINKNSAKREIIGKEKNPATNIV